MKRFSKIVSIALSLALMLSVLAVIPVTTAAQSVVPTKTPSAHDYADDITAFSNTCYGVGSGSLPAWDSTAKGVAVPASPADWGATLATGYSISGGNNSAVVLSANVTPGSADATSKLVFRSASFGNPGSCVNTNIYMVAVGPASVSIESYFLNGDASWSSSLLTEYFSPNL